MLLLILNILLITVCFSFLSLAPWVPTRASDHERVLEILQLKPWEKFLEMGCGTAWVSLFVARAHPDSHIVGVELSPIFYIISKLRVAVSGLSNIEVRYGNALKFTLDEFDALYVFWLPETVTQTVFPKIMHIKNPHFRLLSYCFEMTNTEFEQIRHKPEGKYSIYEYRIVKSDVS